MPAKRTSKERTRKSPTDHTPRPANAWILYRRDMKRLMDETAVPGAKPMRQSELSKILAFRWGQESQDVREKYDKRAELVKLEHLKKYPGYKFNPRTAEEKKREAEEKKLAAAAARQAKAAAKAAEKQARRASGTRKTSRKSSGSSTPALAGPSNPALPLIDTSRSTSAPVAGSSRLPYPLGPPSLGTGPSPPLSDSEWSPTSDGASFWPVQPGQWDHLEAPNPSYAIPFQGSSGSSRSTPSSGPPSYSDGEFTAPPLLNGGLATQGTPSLTEWIGAPPLVPGDLDQPYRAHLPLVTRADELDFNDLVAALQSARAGQVWLAPPDTPGDFNFDGFAVGIPGPSTQPAEANPNDALAAVLDEGAFHEGLDEAAYEATGAHMFDPSVPFSFEELNALQDAIPETAQNLLDQQEYQRAAASEAAFVYGVDQHRPPPHELDPIRVQGPGEIVLGEPEPEPEQAQDQQDQQFAADFSQFLVEDAQRDLNALFASLPTTSPYVGAPSQFADSPLSHPSVSRPSPPTRSFSGQSQSHSVPPPSGPATPSMMAHFEYNPHAQSLPQTPNVDVHAFPYPAPSADTIVSNFASASADNHAIAPGDYYASPPADHYAPSAIDYYGPTPAPVASMPGLPTEGQHTAGFAPTASHEQRRYVSATRAARRRVGAQHPPPHLRGQGLPFS